MKFILPYGISITENDTFSHHYNHLITVVWAQFIKESTFLFVLGLNEKRNSETLAVLQFKYEFWPCKVILSK